MAEEGGVGAIGVLAAELRLAGFGKGELRSRACKRFAGSVGRSIKNA
jgi:hypothetical protein